MRVRLPMAALATLALAACGGGGGSAGPAALAYSLPTQTSAKYMSVDTTTVDIDAMGQSMQVNATSSATYAVAFSRAGAGVGVSLTVEDFSARIAQPMAAPMTADEGGIEGTLDFTVDRLGNVTVNSVPTTSGNAIQAFSPNSIAYGFLPGLPGTAVAAGDMWVDTVAFSVSEGTGDIETESVIHYTLVGDTVVDGRSLLNITFTGENMTRTVADMGGMDVVQTAELEVAGHILWDRGASLLFESVSHAVGSGQAEVAVAPAPMGIAVQTVSRVRLQSGM